MATTTELPFNRLGNNASTNSTVTQEIMQHRIGHKWVLIYACRMNMIKES